MRCPLVCTNREFNRFTVEPSLKISPSSGTAGTTVNISGTGFPAQGMGKLTFDGKSTDVAIAPNDVGSFTSEFIIPDTSVGEHELIATTEYVAATATAELEVVPSASDDCAHGTLVWLAWHATSLLQLEQGI